MNKERRTTPLKAALWAGALALAAAPGFAADTGGTREDKSRKTATTGSLNVSDAEIRGLRERGYSWGDIGRALVIAEQSGKSLNDVTSLRDSGMDWNDIANRWNVQMFPEQKKGKKGGRREPGLREAPSGRGTQQPGTSPATEPGGTAPTMPPGDGSPGGSPGTTNPTPRPGGTPPEP